MDKKDKKRNQENVDDESTKRKRKIEMRKKKQTLEEEFELEEMMCDIEDDSLYYMIKNLR